MRTHQLITSDGSGVYICVYDIFLFSNEFLQATEG